MMYMKPENVANREAIKVWIKLIITSMSDTRLSETYRNISKIDERKSEDTGVRAVKNHGLVTKGV